MNTYIQDKLDEFDKRFSEEIILDQEVRTVVPGIKHFIEQSLTDYHNHIVEKIDKKIDNCYTPSGFNEDAVRGWTRKETLEEVRDLLQDTNPKE